MRRVVVALALGGLVLAGCGGGSGSSVRVIGNCKIQSGTSCPGANLSGADLRGATLDRANLSRVALEGADVSNANLQNTNLNSAVITNADLRGANLSKTKLDLVNLTGSDLTDATLRGATTTTNANIFVATIRCRTILPNGTTDNTSCSVPLPTSTLPTTKPTTATTKKATPTTSRPTPPTTRPTPPTTSPTPPPPCAVDLLQAAYVAQFGPPPDGTTFSLTACAGGYGGTNIDNPNTGPAFAVYQVQGPSWVALNVGTAGVCNGYGIPPVVESQIGCP